MACEPRNPSSGIKMPGVRPGIFAETLVRAVYFGCGTIRM